ncbi:MAG: hypothetical protein PHW53_02555 [Patescibacteria group bacterium]|nr:hypothetical protein [Patescibacteria group bacterium]
MNFIGAGELIKKSWSIYFANFKTLILIAVWSLIPAVAMILVVLIPQELWILSMLLAIVAGIGTMIVGLWVFATMTAIIAKIYDGEQYDVKAISQNAWTKIIPLLWVSILTGFAVFGGTLLFLIPGIIFAVWFTFSSVINVLEGTRGTAALKQSKQLVTGKWWAVLWRLVACYFVYGIIFYIVTAILFLLVGLATGQWEAFASGQYLPWLSNLISQIVNVAAMPLAGAISVILYIELKKFKSMP